MPINNLELYNDTQIAAMRKHFEKIERIDPCSETWLDMQKYVPTIPLALRQQLASAGIKWLSKMCQDSLT